MIFKVKIRYVLGYIIGAALFALVIIYGVNWYFNI